MSRKFEPLKIFLSYSSEDSVLAGNIKSHLEKFGLQVFLAHDDIEPSQDWQKRILLELSVSDIFIPILTEHFHKSNWTDQETGIAIQRGLFIIPLRVNQVPYGFISKYQAHSIKKDVYSSCVDIVKVINNNPIYKTRLLNGLILAFSKSISFEDAKKKGEVITELDGYTKKQVNEIIRASLKNDQIIQSFGAQGAIRTLVRRYGTKIDPSLLSEYRNK